MVTVCCDPLGPSSFPLHILVYEVVYQATSIATWPNSPWADRSPIMLMFTKRTNVETYVCVCAQNKTHSYCHVLSPSGTCPLLYLFPSQHSVKCNYIELPNWYQEVDGTTGLQCMYTWIRLHIEPSESLWVNTETKIGRCVHRMRPLTPPWLIERRTLARLEFLASTPIPALKGYTCNKTFNFLSVKSEDRQLYSTSVFRKHGQQLFCLGSTVPLNVKTFVFYVSLYLKLAWRTVRA